MLIRNLLEEDSVIIVLHLYLVLVQMLLVVLAVLVVEAVPVESAVLAVKEKDINKLELTEKLEEMQLPVQPVVAELHLHILMLDMVATAVTVGSEELEELVGTVVQGVRLDRLHHQLRIHYLHHQNLEYFHYYER